MLIGLTGGIGSGKSTALGIFSCLGWNTLDADLICHQLYQDANCKAYRQMVEKWGKEVLNPDGAIDRKKVAGIIFQDVDEREWLNGVLHPQVLEYAIEEYQQNNATVPMMFDVPLLFEVSWERYFTKMVVVFVEDNIQKERLKARGMSQDEIERRMAAQMPLSEKIEKADYALINNGTEEMLREQCQKLHETLYGVPEAVK